MSNESIGLDLFRNNLFPFIDLSMRVVEGRRFVSSGHGEYIAEVLQDVARKKLRNILITIPPGHSKTFIVANGLIPFIAGNDTSCRSFYVSNKHDLAVKKTGEIKKLLTSDIYGHLYPNFKLAKKGEERMTFEGKRGYIEAKGLMSSITGDNADLIILDDPIDASDTKVEIETAKNKIRNSILNRLRPDEENGNYGFIIINQRTGEDDISKFFLDNYQLGHHINLPFIENEKKIYSFNDVILIRNAGVELNPKLIKKGFVKEAIGDYEKSDVAKRIFETQYQQNPSPTIGELMKISHFGYYSQADLLIKRYDIRHIFITCDTANKIGEKNDYSVMSCWGWDGQFLYLLDMFRGKLEIEELLKAFQSFYKKWQYGFSVGVYLGKIIVEDKASGTQILQMFRTRLPSSLLKGKPRISDKFQRFQIVGAFIQTMKVKLPGHDVKINGVMNVQEEIVAPFLREMVAFTGKNDKHDDICDTLFDACDEVAPLVPKEYSSGLIF